jgi:hypothetical protein
MPILVSISTQADFRTRQDAMSGLASRLFQRLVHEAEAEDRAPPSAFDIGSVLLGILESHLFRVPAKSPLGTRQLEECVAGWSQVPENSAPRVAGSFDAELGARSDVLRILFKYVISVPGWISGVASVWALPLVLGHVRPAAWTPLQLEGAAVGRPNCQWLLGPRCRKIHMIATAQVEPGQELRCDPRSLADVTDDGAESGVRSLWDEWAVPVAPNRHQMIETHLKPGLDYAVRCGTEDGEEEEALSRAQDTKAAWRASVEGLLRDLDQVRARVSAAMSEPPPPADQALAGYRAITAHVRALRHICGFYTLLFADDLDEASAKLVLAVAAASPEADWAVPGEPTSFRLASVFRAATFLCVHRLAHQSVRDKGAATSNNDGEAAYLNRQLHITAFDWVAASTGFPLIDALSDASATSGPAQREAVARAFDFAIFALEKGSRDNVEEVWATIAPPLPRANDDNGTIAPPPRRRPKKSKGKSKKSARRQHRARRSMRSEEFLVSHRYDSGEFRAFYRRVLAAGKRTHPLTYFPGTPAGFAVGDFERRLIPGHVVRAPGDRFLIFDTGGGCSELAPRYLEVLRARYPVFRTAKIFSLQHLTAPPPSAPGPLSRAWIDLELDRTMVEEKEEEEETTQGRTAGGGAEKKDDSLPRASI